MKIGSTIPCIVRVCVTAGVVCGLSAVPRAGASDGAVIRLYDRDLPLVVRAAAGADPADEASLQRAYDHARLLENRVDVTRADTIGCRILRDGLRRIAQAAVGVADGFDRRDPGQVRTSRSALAAGRRRVAVVVRDCRVPSRRGAPLPPAVVLTEPVPHAVAAGSVRVVLPPGADAGEVRIDGQVVGALAVHGGGGTARLPDGAGRHSVSVGLSRGGRAVATATSDDVWIMPAGWRVPAGTQRSDGHLDAALRRAAGALDGVGAAWVRDVGSGRTGGWNAEARFPAASTVKLAVMIEAARRAGRAPDRSPFAADVRAIGARSSNLAANRLLPLVGGTASVQRRLTAMGAARSTFPAAYRVATARLPDPVAPPIVSRRVTTAADLGRVLTVLYDSSLGDAGARRRSGLTSRQARFVLGALLASERRGDNAGVLGGMSADRLAAQKNGWIRSVRHTAAIVDTPRGPVVVVALTWSPVMTAARARRFGSRVLAVVDVM